MNNPTNTREVEQLDNGQVELLLPQFLDQLRLLQEILTDSSEDDIQHSGTRLKPIVFWREGRRTWMRSVGENSEFQSSSQ